MRWPNSSSFSSHTRTVPSPLCRKSPKVTSVSSSRTNTRTHLICEYKHHSHKMDMQWLPSLFAPLCWYPAPTFAAGLFLWHMGVAHSGSRPGLGVFTSSETWFSIWQPRLNVSETLASRFSRMPADFWTVPHMTSEPHPLIRIGVTFPCN